MERNEIDLVKEQICDVCHKCWQLGWVAANDGNVSARLDDGTFLATPTGMSKSMITPELLLRIDGTGKVLGGAEGLRPSSEIKMHMRCYEKRDDVRSVIHAHPPAATGFAVAHRPMDMYNMIEDVAVIGAVPVTPYGTPSTVEVPNAIEPYLDEHDVMLLENHGALAVGSDVLTAFYRMESLELWAKITINAIILGGSYDISRENVQKLIDLRGFYRVTGRHPGYKKFDRAKEGEPTDR
ncbi:MAG: class II aldolase/adducin family protein [Eubacteriales bacterium]|nr:class II aldolase/adducin family protein [Eubacteriales bacterium]